MGAVPLRIEWTVVTPWCPPSPAMHLDGLLAWAQLQSYEREGRTITSFDEVLDNLPFETHVGEFGWVWKASMIRPREVLGSERRYMTAKTAVSELSERMVDGKILGRPIKTIDTVRGPFKNDAFWYTLEHVRECVAYCVGDPDRIVALLDLVTHLGKRARLDHGRIDPEKTVVTEDVEALTRWSERYMPDPIDGYVPMVGRARPPYWMGEGMMTVYRPL